MDGRLAGAIDFKNVANEKISHQGSFGVTIFPGYRNNNIGHALLE